MHRPPSLAFLPLLLLACSEPFAVEEDGLGTDAGDPADDALADLVLRMAAGAHEGLHRGADRGGVHVADGA